MNGITILIWITIAIIGLIAAILVKLHYNGKQLETEDGSILEDAGSITNVFSKGQELLSRNKNDSNPAQLNQSKSNNIDSTPISFNDIYEEPAAYEVENDTYENIEYESQNQVLINYDDTVEKFQEPIKQSQMDIMSQNNDLNEKHELKDLFTIDELIKESKRKDSEREKEALKTDEEDSELEELKESIKQKQEEKNIEQIIDELPEETIQDILSETSTEESSESEETISDLINETSSDVVDETKQETKIETPTITSQDIEEAISTASKESEEEVESISESAGITDALLNNEESETQEVIKEPILKSPTKVTDDYKFGADIDDGNVFGEYANDLDYRKDLAKITNTIKGSKIFKDVKDKLKSEPVEEPEIEDNIEETFIRNVNEYEDEFTPIINETHADYEATYEDYHNADYDQRMRQENSRKVFNIVNTPKTTESKIGTIKEKPARDNIKIQLNN
ncbi:hypothetical protein, partial [Methanobrevibacter sp.]|uniref:hypothetical protein n=1 Tax=Methanobrevibacter sp. TaxID=66852 RepID=UPI0026DF8D90